MFSLDSQSIDFACPMCGFYNEVTIGQVRLRDAVICRGCNGTLNLDDHMNETKKAVRSINQAMRELEKSISKVGRITIRL